MSKSKIAFVGGFAFSPKGTMSARAYPLAAELVKVGHEVTMFLPPYDHPEDCGQEWEREGVRIKNVGAKVSYDRNTGRLAKREYARLLFELIRDIRHYLPDMVHIFKPKGFAGAVGSYFLLRGAPAVLDCDDWEGWGGWNEVKAYPWMVKEYIDRQERWMMRRANAVTAASRVLQSRAAELRGDDGRVFYLPNCGASAQGHELQNEVRKISPMETRRQLGLPERPLVLFSGHKDDAGAVQMMQYMVARIAHEVPVTMVLVGGEIAANPTGGNENIVHFPRLSYRDFLRVVWACDFAAFPFSDDPVHWAKCSARIIDYMAMGKAVLTSAVGQNLEYIVNRESGVLVAPGDEPAFALKLKELVCNAELRSRLGANAARRIAEKFRWDGDALQQCLAAYECASSSGKTRQAKAETANNAVQFRADGPTTNRSNLS